MRPVDYVILVMVGVLLVVVSFFMTVPMVRVSESELLDRGCQTLRTTCDQESIFNIFVYGNATGNYTLANICAKSGYVNSVSCARFCGCNVTGTAAQLHTEPLKSYSEHPFNEGVFIIEGAQ